MTTMDLAFCRVGLPVSLFAFGHPAHALGAGSVERPNLAFPSPAARAQPPWKSRHPPKASAR